MSQFLQSEDDDDLQDLVAGVGGKPAAAAAADKKSAATESHESHESPPPAERLLECAICCSDIPARDVCPCSGAGEGEEAAAAHGIFCNTCIGTHIRTLVSEGRVSTDALACPASGCHRAYTFGDVARLSGHADAAKYRKFLTALDSAMVFCPLPGCECVAPRASLTGNGGRRLDCKGCGGASCVTCGKPWHALPTCAVTAGMTPMSVQFSLWKTGGDAKRCPSCSYLIQKNGGCNHMTCRRCSHEFNWCCLQSYRSHNSVLCKPLTFYHSNHRAFGPTAPLRFVTKSAVVPLVGSAGAVAGALAGAGLSCYLVVRVLHYVATENRVARALRERRRRIAREQREQRLAHIREERRLALAAQTGMRRLAMLQQCPVGTCSHWFTYSETLQRHLTELHANEPPPRLLRSGECLCKTSPGALCHCEGYEPQSGRVGTRQGLCSGCGHHWANHDAADLSADAAEAPGAPRKIKVRRASVVLKPDHAASGGAAADEPTAPPQVAASGAAAPDARRRSSGTRRQPSLHPRKGSQLGVDSFLEEQRVMAGVQREIQAAEQKQKKDQWRKEMAPYMPKEVAPPRMPGAAQQAGGAAVEMHAAAAAEAAEPLEQLELEGQLGALDTLEHEVARLSPVHLQLQELSEDCAAAALRRAVDALDGCATA